MYAQTIAVLGLGIFGQTVARELASYDTEIIAIDRYPENVARIADLVAVSVVGDFTDINLLKEAGIDRADIVIITAGSKVEDAVLAATHAKELGIKHIIGKAYGTMVEEILYQVGVDTVITPEKESGFLLASRILNKDVGEILRLDDNTSIIEFQLPKDWISKSPKQLDLRRKFGIHLIGYRQNKEGKMMAIDADTPLQENYTLVAISHPGKLKDLEF